MPDDTPDRILVQIEVLVPRGATGIDIVDRLEALARNSTSGPAKLLWWRLADGGQG